MDDNQSVKNYKDKFASKYSSQKYKFAPNNWSPKVYRDNRYTLFWQYDFRSYILRWDVFMNWVVR